LKVVVYVEGAGDRACLDTLLAPLIAAKAMSGVYIQFVPATRGDRKVALLTKEPVKAAHTVMNDKNASVVILPDLYPANKAFRHTTCGEMRAGVEAAFHRALDRSHSTDERVRERFRVFCLIHDLEVLLLAAEESLLKICGLSEPLWTKPVEEQDHHRPPKRILEQLIPRYDPTVDGPRVLAGIDYRMVAERCPNGFGPFVKFLESVAMT
jgi:hypothetical protein